jgi:hypothetical protein
MRDWQENEQQKARVQRCCKQVGRDSGGPALLQAAVVRAAFARLYKAAWGIIVQHLHLHGWHENEQQHAIQVLGGAASTPAEAQEA